MKNKFKIQKNINCAEFLKKPQKDCKKELPKSQKSDRL